MTASKRINLAQDQQRPASADINALPPELLVKIWQYLGKASPDSMEESDREELAITRRTVGILEPHPGLRSYPFLGQVCKHWKGIMERQEVCNQLWEEVIVDFGHELITAVHTPIAWSDQRPGEDEFKESFSKARLDSGRILAFLAQRRTSLKHVTLMNSEGYYSDDHDFVNLVNKHDFTMVSFGLMCGLMYDQLESLTILRCSDWFNVGCGAFGTIASLKNLRCLRIEDLHCRMDLPTIAASLSKLVQLTELALTMPGHRSGWMGLEKIPYSWARLTNLERLTLRGHLQLTDLPIFLGKLPLRMLDLTNCLQLNLAVVHTFSSLDTLLLTGMNLSETSVPLNPLNLGLGYSKPLPDLSDLVRLTALNLAENMLQIVPPFLSKLTNLRILDLKDNDELKLEIVNFKNTHMEYEIPYWSAAKCVTMENIVGWRKAVRRRGGNMKTLVEYASNQ